MVNVEYKLKLYSLDSSKLVEVKQVATVINSAIEMMRDAFLNLHIEAMMRQSRVKNPIVYVEYVSSSFVEVKNG